MAKLAKATGQRWPLVGRRLVSNFPYIEAEVTYAMKEYAESVTDVLARRTRVAFLNTQSAQEAIPIIADMMAKEKKWSNERKAASYFFTHHTFNNESSEQSQPLSLVASYTESIPYEQLIQHT